MKVKGVFLGSGAARNIGLGFVPSRVTIQNVHAADLGTIEWDSRFAAKATAAEGIKTLIHTYGTTPSVADVAVKAALTVGTGVAPYAGGTIPSSATAANILPTHLVADYAGDMRAKGTLGLVDKFTLTHADNPTGKFNAGVNTTYVGVGSRVRIGGQWYTITALTNDGDADDEVTLDRRPSVGTQVADKILYPYDFVACPAGVTMPAGIVLSETADVNASNELVLIEAE